MDDAIPWPEIIRNLVDGGMTQPQIAEACDCGQSTISDMLRGNRNISDAILSKLGLRRVVVRTR